MATLGRSPSRQSTVTAAANPRWRTRRSAISRQHDRNAYRIANMGANALIASLSDLCPASEFVLAPAAQTELAGTVIPDMLRRDLAHKGLLSESVAMDWRLLAWVEIV